MDNLSRIDPEVFKAIQAEKQRQMSKIELIASENFASEGVMEAAGSVLTNKYAEGLPGKRYYGGCEYVDIVENLARDRVKALFGAEHANVQPHSGAQANMAVYFAALKPGDTVMGMNLAHGGHLTHGSPVNFSGQLYNFISYGVDPETERLNYDDVERLAREHRPKLLVAGASAYPRSWDFARLGTIAGEVGALFMVDMAHFAGLVAAGLHPNPVPHAHFVTSTTHKTLRGPRGGIILCRSEYAAGIDKAVFPGIQGGPLMHIIAAKAVAFKEAATPGFNEYAQRILENAQALASGLLKRGFRLVSGGTDNHLMLVNLTNKDVTGKAAEHALDLVGITVNKNAVPFDQKSPFVTSGIRIGTPAVTTRGMGTNDMAVIADLIAETIENMENQPKLEAVAGKVKELTSSFPLFKD